MPSGRTLDVASIISGRRDIRDEALIETSDTKEVAVEHGAPLECTRPICIELLSGRMETWRLLVGSGLSTLRMHNGMTFRGRRLQQRSETTGKAFTATDVLLTDEAGSGPSLSRDVGIRARRRMRYLLVSLCLVKNGVTTFNSIVVPPPCVHLEMLY